MYNLSETKKQTAVILTTARTIISKRKRLFFYQRQNQSLRLNAKKQLSEHF